MHFPAKRPVRLLLGLLLLTAQPAVSESSPEAQKWLDKLVGIYDQGSFLLDFDGTLSLSQPGASMNGTLEGKITYGDAKHLRAALEMERQRTQEAETRAKEAEARAEKAEKAAVKATEKARLMKQAVQNQKGEIKSLEKELQRMNSQIVMMKANQKLEGRKRK